MAHGMAEPLTGLCLFYWTTLAVLPVSSYIIIELEQRKGHVVDVQVVTPPP
jgi:hypothetical protein